MAPRDHFSIPGQSRHRNGCPADGAGSLQIKKRPSSRNAKRASNHRTSPDKQKHVPSDSKGHGYPFAGPVIPVDIRIPEGSLSLAYPTSYGAW